MRGLEGAEVRRYVLHVVALPTLVFAVHLAVAWSYYAGPQVEDSDLAVAALQVHRAARLRELVGPYSRFDFHHPGPISFYYYAATEPLLSFVPTPLGRHLLAQLFLNLAFLLVALHATYVLARHRSEPMLLAAAFFAVFACSDLGSNALPNVWSPYLLIFPMLAFLTTASAVALGRLAFVLPASVAAVFVIHNHVSGIVVVAPILVGSLFACWLQRRNEQLPKTGRVSALVAAGVVALTSVPPLIEQCVYSDGNLSKIGRFVLEQAGQHRGPRPSAHFVASFFRAPVDFLGINGEFWAALLVVACVVVWQVGGRFERRLAVVFVASLLLSIFGASRVLGELHRGHLTAGATYGEFRLPLSLLRPLQENSILFSAESCGANAHPEGFGLKAVMLNLETR